jgi:flagellar motility protein MotE (MotC chaperone)
MRSRLSRIGAMTRLGQHDEGDQDDLQETDMKGIFLLVSVAAAGAFSLLSIIFSTGSIPFRAEDNEALGQSTQQPAVLRASDSQFLDGLVVVLEAERGALQERETDIEYREATLEKQRQIVEQLKAEIENTDARVKAAVVEMKTAELRNLRQLATMYSKMEATNAGTLLRELDSKRAAKILSLCSDREAAAILDALLGQGSEGAKVAAEWSDIIRRLRPPEIKKK